MSNDPAEEICPVCGYYCLGDGGQGCIDKPYLFALKQERLPPEFEKVLHNNLWELYDSDED